MLEALRSSGLFMDTHRSVTGTEEAHRLAVEGLLLTRCSHESRCHWLFTTATKKEEVRLKSSRKQVMPSRRHDPRQRSLHWFRSRTGEMWSPTFYYLCYPRV